MKKFLMVCAICSAFVFVTGCASRGGTTKASNLPDFVTNPPDYEDAILGIGSANLSSDQQARQMAESRARQDIAFQLSTQVKAMITDYAREAGAKNDKASLELAETIGRQLTNVTLKDTKVLKREKTRDGTWYVLMSYKKSSAAQAAADATKGVIDNEASRYAEFKAMEATKLMDERLEKADMKPGNIKD
ncbi:MAG: LPP20 family lipoprotein [Spirochaetaceae bacterium]|jgi:hypothetical protein|nr:LPP20 family lipoprotein [Spirochaetaceae bacterium]